MKCPKCGKQIKDGSTRCFQCGTWFNNLDSNSFERPMMEQKESFSDRFKREWQNFSASFPFNFSGIKTYFVIVLVTIVLILEIAAVLKLTGF